MWNADWKRRVPAPIYGSSEVGEVSTELVSRDGHESISLVMPDEVAPVGVSLVSTSGLPVIKAQAAATKLAAPVVALGASLA